MNTLLCALAVLLALVVGILTWATETPADRARRWHRSGWSQRAIAGRLGVSRYRVRCYLAAA
jgi:DNA-binding transcriptional regulator LsrR (DeoR family)